MQLSDYRRMSYKDWQDLQATVEAGAPLEFLEVMHSAVVGNTKAEPIGSTHVEWLARMSLQRSLQTIGMRCYATPRSVDGIAR